MALKRDATIRDVWLTLTHQKNYVSGVLREMGKCIDQRGNASVRISVTGTGQKPYYRISSTSESGEEVFGSFFDNHEPFSAEFDFKETGNWSSAAMSYAELQDFYAAKIGYSGVRPVRKTAA